MQKLTCLIVEDEPIAAEVLQDYIQEVSIEIGTILRNLLLISKNLESL